MEFAEVENLHDFYSAEGRLVHTQDQRGFYIVYDAALKDLEDLEEELLLLGSCFIQKSWMKMMRSTTSSADVNTWTRTDVDHVAVLLDLWTCETEFLESKVQVETRRCFICFKRHRVHVIPDTPVNYDLLITLSNFRLILKDQI